MNQQKKSDNMMRGGLRSLSVALLLAVMCSSCCTKALWDRVDPYERVFVPASATSEAELVRKHVEFERTNSKRYPGYVVEKSTLRKFGDYTLLTLATPLTLAVDVAGFGALIYLCPNVSGSFP